MGQDNGEFKSKKGLLKGAFTITRADRPRHRALAEGLWHQFEPRTPYEEFLLEKLIVDLGRLAKLYAYEKKEVFDANDLAHDLANGYTDRFIRYKNRIEKDINDGYRRLENIKRMRH